MVCCSMGKDSVAMLVKLLEDGSRVDRVLFCDTHYEYPELYGYLEFLDAWLQENHNLKIEILEPVPNPDGSERTFLGFMRGVVKRGKRKGTPRGVPPAVGPCWWSRDAKIKPLIRATAEAEIVYVGYSADEVKRVGKQRDDPRYRFPLIDWGMGEQDCYDFLACRGLTNPIYDYVKRSGCFHCPKQPLPSWFQLWDKHPKLWDTALAIDRESIKLAGHGLVHASYKTTLDKLAERFESQGAPRNTGGLECNSCPAVGMVLAGELTLQDFQEEALEKELEGFKLEIEIEARRSRTEPKPGSSSDPGPGSES